MLAVGSLVADPGTMGTGVEGGADLHPPAVQFPGTTGAGVADRQKGPGRFGIKHTPGPGR